MTFDAVGASRFVLDISLRALAAAAVALILRLLRMRAAAVLHSVPGLRISGARPSSICSGQRR
jgi:hypothetical protein